MKIYELIKNKSEVLFFSLIFYGLSISILFKELYLIIFDYEPINILVLYRFLIIFSSIILFFLVKKKINIKIFALILPCAIFIINSLHNPQMNFSIDGINFFRLINTKLDYSDIFFSSKHKIIIINFFNIIIPLIIIGFINLKKFNFSDFYLTSFKICKIYFYCVILFILCKYYFFLKSDKSIENYFLNIHSMIFILNIYFFMLVDKIIRLKNFKNEYFINLFIIILTFLIINGYLHMLTCVLTVLIYLYLLKKNSLPFYFLFFIIASILIYIFFLRIYDYPYLIYLIYEPGTFINSILIRIKTIEYFMLYSTNINYITGNNIFSDQAAIYPHNLFVDILICSGLIGVLIYIYFIVKILKNLKYFIDDKLLLIFIFFQSFIFSLFSGFAFTNITFNIALAICFCLIKENDEKIV